MLDNRHKITRAMVFAAGLGTRMQPLTLEIPKPLLKIKGKALIDYTLDNIKSAGIKSAVVNTHYMPQMIENHLSKRSDLSISISYEKQLLETGGGVLKVLSEFQNQPFLSVNTDTILADKGESVSELINHWRDEMDMLLLLQPLKTAFGYDGRGDFDLSGDGKIMKVPGKTSYPYVFTGTQIINPRIFSDHPPGPFSLNYYYKKAADENGELKGIYGLVNQGKWLHIGTPEALEKAEAII